MGVIEFSDGVSRLPNNSGFNIKNDGEEPVTLEVTLDKMDEFRQQRGEIKTMNV